MVKYAKVIDAGTHRCEIGIGSNHVFYESIGMELMNVEQGYDGNWYLSGFAPLKNEKIIRMEKKKARLKELQAYLSSTDWYVIRFADTVEPVPADVQASRASARAEIDMLREELAKFEEKVI